MFDQSIEVAKQKKERKLHLGRNRMARGMARIVKEHTVNEGRHGKCIMS